MENLPISVSLLFVLTTFLTVLFFFKATNFSKSFLIIVLLWLVVQTILSLSGFYKVVDTMPPRFFLLIMPPLLLMAGLFFTPAGRSYLDRLDLKTLTLMHIIRVPVEVVLYWLFTNKAIPQLMTFEGRNFDILSGISAPFIYYFGFVKKQINKKVILFWNFICLTLLINIVINAVLSAPLPFQQFAFDQPNIALLFFPFVWLPCCVVPLVLLSHLTAIRQLLLSNKKLLPQSNKFSKLK